MQNRRIIDGIFRSVGAKPVPAVETNSIYNLVSHVSAGQWSAIVPRQLLRFFGLPRGTRAIELVEPIARRTIGLVMSDREPPSPLARNLFAMQWPADIAALIEPPNRPSEAEGMLDRKSLSNLPKVQFEHARSRRRIVLNAIWEDVMAGQAAFDVELARTLIDRRRATRGGGCCRSCTICSDRFGYIDDAAIPLIADALNISRAETLGVVSFYHDFRRSPVDGRVLKLCRAESCQAMGCEDLVAHLEARHGVKPDERGRGRRAPCRNGLLPRQLRAFAVRAARRRADRPSRPRSPRRDRRRRPREDAMSVRVFVPARFLGACPSARTPSRRRCRAKRAAAASTSRSCAPARAASSGWSRWSRSRPPAGRVGYGPVAPERRGSLFEAGFPDAAARIPRRSAGSRTSPISQGSSASSSPAAA